MDDPANADDTEGDLLVAARNLLSLRSSSSIDDLFARPMTAERILTRVWQDSPMPMKKALVPVMTAPIKDKLLKHPHENIQVIVASCLNQATRITAPVQPYVDHQMRDVFRLFMVVLRQFFFDIIRPNHSVAIFKYMVAVLTLVIGSIRMNNKLVEETAAALSGDGESELNGASEAEQAGPTSQVNEGEVVQLEMDIGVHQHRRGRKPNSLMRPGEGYEHIWTIGDKNSSKVSRDSVEEANTGKRGRSKVVKERGSKSLKKTAGLSTAEKGEGSHSCTVSAGKDKLSLQEPDVGKEIGNEINSQNHESRDDVASSNTILSETRT
ncbi:hypothetical protein ABFS83_04G109500 [Erythranthe nasuta]